MFSNANVRPCVAALLIVAMAISSPSHAEPRSKIQSRRRAPSDFQFVFRWGADGRMIFDSRRGTLTCDMVVGPDSTIAMTLTSAQLDTLHATMLEVGMFDLPEPHPPRRTTSVGAKSQFNELTLEVRADGRTKSFRWDDEDIYPGHDPQWESLGRVVMTVWRYLAVPASQRCPAPRAWRD
ncbi:MAG: hypothetical protein H7062_21185 [Candidatus Saccharimonas sp.]|nr:hypothetical protein [Planctomycetaceae bacterium]